MSADDFVFCEAAAEWDHDWRPVDDDGTSLACSECGVRSANSRPVGQDYHVGRSWSGHELEDDCPCPKAPCGLVRVVVADPSCTEHPDERCKTLRQIHLASRCPAA